jgi:hypothetical protein
MARVPSVTVETTGSHQAPLSTSRWMSIAADPHVLQNQMTISCLTISALSSRLAGGFFGFPNHRSQSLSLEVTSVSKLSVCTSLFLLCLGSSFASVQNSAHTTRQPIAVTSGYFASLKAAPKHSASNKLSSAANAAALNADPRIVSIPNFTSSFKFGGTTYPYTMVGQNPRAHQTTVVPTTYTCPCRSSSMSLSIRTATISPSTRPRLPRKSSSHRCSRTQATPQAIRSLRTL